MGLKLGVERSGVEMSFNLLKVINEDEEIYKTVIGDFVQRIQPQLRKFLKDPGAKYLGFFSSRSLKTREKCISFAQLVLLSLYIF